MTGWADCAGAACPPVPDDALLADVAPGARAVWRVWRMERCLVVPAREVRLPGFAAAAVRAAAAGWPLRQRRSGGLAVPNGPGLLNLSVAFATHRPNPEQGYALLRDAVADTLASFGLAAASGAVAGAFCDGAHNLVVGGRKLAGTAQRWRATGGGTAVLAHALILVDPDIGLMLRRLEDYYRWLGHPRAFKRSAVVTLRELGVDAGLFGCRLRQRVQTPDAGPARPAGAGA